MGTTKKWSHELVEELHDSMAELGTLINRITQTNGEYKASLEKDKVSVQSTPMLADTLPLSLLVDEFYFDLGYLYLDEEDWTATGTLRMGYTHHGDGHNGHNLNWPDGSTIRLSYAFSLPEYDNRRWDTYRKHWHIVR